MPSLAGVPNRPLRLGTLIGASQGFTRPEFGSVAYPELDPANLCPERLTQGR